MQECGNSRALALDLPQSRTKPLICVAAAALFRETLPRRWYRNTVSDIGLVQTEGLTGSLCVAHYPICPLIYSRRDTERGSNHEVY